jgi:hypothetical protein
VSTHQSSRVALTPHSFSRRHSIQRYGIESAQSECNTVRYARRVTEVASPQAVGRTVPFAAIYLEPLSAFVRCALPVACCTSAPVPCTKPASAAPQANAAAGHCAHTPTVLTEARLHGVGPPAHGAHPSVRANTPQWATCELKRRRTMQQQHATSVT